MKGNTMTTTQWPQLARFTAALLFGSFSVCSAGYAASAMAPAKMEGGVLVGENGKTLYVFDKDANGKSMCNGKCAENWPPLTADGGASGDFSVITRGDGKKQYAYKGKPLYYWSKDQKPGDKTGDGFNNLWHVAK